MPREFIKEVGRPGTFLTEGAAVTVTDKDFDEFIENFHDMQKSGLEIPVPFAHPDALDQMGYPVDGKNRSEIEKRERDYLTAGWMTDLFRDTDGKVKARIEIARDEDADRIEKVGSFVSPQLSRYTNPLTGKTYRRAISHMAITPRPLNPQQTKEFKAVQALSLDAASEKYPVIQMAGEPMYDESGMRQTVDDEYDPNDPEGEKAKGKKPPTEREKLVCCLRNLGIAVPENWNGDLKVLLAAAETYSIANKGLAGGSQSMQEPGGKKAPLKTEPSVLVMSIDANAKAKFDEAVAAGKMTADEAKRIMELADAGVFQMSIDPERKPPHPTPTEPTPKPPEPKPEPVVQMSQTEKALQAEVTTLRREKYLQRIDANLKRGAISPEVANEMKQRAGTYQFAADAPADAILEAELRMADRMRDGAAWDDQQRVQQMATREEPRDPFMTPDGSNITEEEAEKFASEAARLMGYGNEPELTKTN